MRVGEESKLPPPTERPAIPSGIPPPLEPDATSSAASAVALKRGRGCDSEREEEEEEDEDARSSSRICRWLKAASDPLSLSALVLLFPLPFAVEMWKPRLVPACTAGVVTRIGTGAALPPIIRKDGMKAINGCVVAILVQALSG